MIKQENNLIKKSAITGIMFAAVFATAWFILPTRGAASSALLRTAKEAAI